MNIQTTTVSTALTAIKEHDLDITALLNVVRADAEQWAAPLIDLAGGDNEGVRNAMMVALYTSQVMTEIEGNLYGMDVRVAGYDRDAGTMTVAGAKVAVSDLDRLYDPYSVRRTLAWELSLGHLSVLGVDEDDEDFCLDLLECLHGHQVWGIVINQ